MINLLAAFIILSGYPQEKLLDDISEKYASAGGIQWRIRSVVYSDVFEEAETTYVEFALAPPDTISVSGDLEKILGIGDTLWVMSVRHRQVQKKSMTGYLTPFDFILNWNKSYELDSYSKDGSLWKFKLIGKNGVTPNKLAVSSDRNHKIKDIIYIDTKGDEVTLTILDEELKRPEKIDLFYQSIPDDYDYIDLTE